MSMPRFDEPIENFIRNKIAIERYFESGGHGRDFNNSVNEAHKGVQKELREIHKQAKGIF